MYIHFLIVKQRDFFEQNETIFYPNASCQNITKIKYCIVSMFLKFNI